MRIILLLALTLTSLINSPKQGIAHSITIHNWRASLLTSNGRYIVDVVQAEDYTSAVNAVRRRYPNCTIYSINRLD